MNIILTNFCQVLAVFVIFIGVTKALIIFLKYLLFKPPTPEGFHKSRLAMGYSFSLGLSFLIGASILNTMISSKWDDIARLIVIIAIRTVLNYFLMQAIDNSGESASLNSKQITDLKPNIQQINS
ncbi:DUF1622 domain-containing protein [Aphanothece sacrum]|uniref:DUF1622 domain-containing protein n=1 Tax=Aphanothece sacrum TaxID=1122 RepID=UPI000FFA9E52|nr:DUF1622 domain-containing protein [Aphanothece sacrum]GBF85179.1 hypothetical protein AsFPU3_2236 [Aphanothece sacrum FPU3]